MKNFNLYIQKWFEYLIKIGRNDESNTENIEAELDGIWYSLTKDEMIQVNSLYRLLKSMDTIDPMLEYLSSYIIDLHTNDKPFSYEHKPNNVFYILNYNVTTHDVDTGTSTNSKLNNNIQTKYAGYL